METIQLNENILYDQVEVTENTEFTKLIGEVSVRVNDLYDLDAIRCVMFIQQILRIYRVSPASFSLALKVLSGSGEEKKTYTELAKKAGTSRQYQHKQRQRELAKLSKEFPKVAEILSKSLWKQR